MDSEQGSIDPITVLTFLVVISNAGGEGKTLLSLLAQALWQLKGEPVLLLDGDPGNLAAKVTDHDAKVLGWGVKAIKASEIVAAAKGMHAVLDLGANALASAREICELLPVLQRLFREAGYQTVALLPVSTNKTGSVQAIVDLEPKIEGFEKLFVKVNRDGSGTFDEGLNPQNTIGVDHLMPGLLNYISAQGSIAQAITEPSAGFSIAASMVAEWARSFARQEHVRTIFGDAAAVLDVHVGAPKGPMLFSIMDRESASDSALTENVHRSRIIEAINKSGWSADGLKEVARLLGTGQH